MAAAARDTVGAAATGATDATDVSEKRLGGAPAAAIGGAEVAERTARAAPLLALGKRKNSGNINCYQPSVDQTSAVC